MMSSSPKIIIGILTFCNEETPQRFEIMKRALPSLEKLKGENVFFTLWDNNSSKEVRGFLDTLTFIDFKYFSSSNLYDVAPIQFLSRAAKTLDCDYVCHMEDDLLVFDDNSKVKLDSLMTWMDTHPEIGGSRILKWEVDNQDRYNKRSHDMTKVDKANMQSHLNVVSGESLELEGFELFDEETNLDICRVIKTNWHWYNFPVVCKRSVYESIIPNSDIEPLQAQEGYMMKKYYDTSLKLAALDGGILTHLAPPTPTSGTSVRYHMKNKFQKNKPENMGKEMPIISMKTASEEAENAITMLEKYYGKT